MKKNVFTMLCIAGETAVRDTWVTRRAHRRKAPEPALHQSVAVVASCGKVSNLSRALPLSPFINYPYRDQVVAEQVRLLYLFTKGCYPDKDQKW